MGKKDQFTRFSFINTQKKGYSQLKPFKIIENPHQYIILDTFSYATYFMCDFYNILRINLYLKMWNFIEPIRLLNMYNFFSCFIWHVRCLWALFSVGKCLECRPRWIAWTIEIKESYIKWCEMCQIEAKKLIYLM